MPGSRSPTSRSYAGHNDLGTAELLAAMAATASTGWCSPRSMVVYGEGRYACAEPRRPQLPAARPRSELDAGRFETAARRLRRAAGLGAGPRGRAARPAQQLCREQGRAGALRARVGASGAGARVALRYHNVYGPGMPRDTPYSGVAAIFRSALEAGEAPRVFEDGGQVRDFVHVADVARANVLALEAVSPRPPSRGRRTTSARAHPVTIADVARILAEGPADREPQVTGEYRHGDVRHVVASPERATATSASPPRSRPSRASPSSRPPRCALPSSSREPGSRLATTNR